MKKMLAMVFCVVLFAMPFCYAESGGGETVYAPLLSTAEHKSWYESQLDLNKTPPKCIHGPQIEVFHWPSGKPRMAPLVTFRGTLIVRTFLGSPWSDNVDIDTKTVAPILLLSPPVIFCHVPEYEAGSPDGHFSNTPQ